MMMLLITAVLVIIAGGIATWYFVFGPGRKAAPTGSKAAAGTEATGAAATVENTTTASEGTGVRYECPIVERCEITGPTVCDRGDVVKPAGWVLTRTADDGIKCSQIRKRQCESARCYTPVFETEAECSATCIREDRRDSARPTLEPKKS
jgi:hypothetical protein